MCGLIIVGQAMANENMEVECVNERRDLLSEADFEFVCQSFKNGLAAHVTVAPIGRNHEHTTGVYVGRIKVIFGIGKPQSLSAKLSVDLDGRGNTQQSVVQRFVVDTRISEINFEQLAEQAVNEAVRLIKR